MNKINSIIKNGEKSRVNLKKFIIVAEDDYGRAFIRFIYGESEKEIEDLAKRIYDKRFEYVEEIDEDYFYTKEELLKENEHKICNE